MLAGGSGCRPGGGSGDSAKAPESGEEGGAKATDHAAEVAALEAPERAAWAMPDEVVAALPIASPDEHIADIGAGSGYFTRRIAARVPDGLVYAVDVDSTYKRFIEEHREGWGTPNIEPRLALYENPLLPVDSLDGVFLSNTYRFIEGRETYFQGVHDSLHAGGWLVIVSWRADAHCEGAAAKACPPVEDRVELEVIRKELAAAGFELESEAEFLPVQNFLVFRR